MTTDENTDLRAMLSDMTGLARWKIEKALLITAGRIIREGDDEGLAAIAASTNTDDDLWGAMAMAQYEQLRRIRAA
jgi:hypothetical protein